MDPNIFYVGESGIKLNTPRPITPKDVRRLFEKFGEIKQVVSHDDFQLIYFTSKEAAEKCIQQFDGSRVAETDLASTGDTGNMDQEQKPNKMKRSRKMFSKMMRQVSELSGFLEETVHHESKNMDQYIPSCSSPVLLNTMDPGFRLAYCHDAQNSQPIEVKPGRMNRFSQSIKKYMDNTPELSTQQLILTNLPTDFKEEDVRELCGMIEPETIELKKTSSINILYANVRTRTRDDFEKLMKILGNRLVDGMKIITIPITKVENPSFGQSSSTHE